MRLELVEPLRDLFKDEVRRLGIELGLPESMVWRQPFPGPGLAVRILGEVTRERVAVLQQADAIVRGEIAAAGLEREVWQGFAVLAADIRSVGVMGDERTYGHPIIVRAVTSDDAMTADWARLPADVLERISNRIVNEVDGINRVVVRHHVEAARHDRVGVNVSLGSRATRPLPSRDLRASVSACVAVPLRPAWPGNAMNVHNPAVDAT